MKVEITIVWPDGFKSAVVDEHTNVHAKALAQLRRAGSQFPITLSHELRDLVYGPEGAIHGGVHTYTGLTKHQFIAKRVD
ncbi:hypothetical protein [Salmonella phage PMBT28]|nr:hypothetical protein [Salmonella phage PMBT28]